MSIWSIQGRLGVMPKRQAMRLVLASILGALLVGGLVFVASQFNGGPPDINARSPSVNPEIGGWTVLHIAAQEGDVARIRALLGEGADPTIADNSGETALYYAVGGAEDEAKAAECVTILAKGGADVNAAQNAGWSPLHQACSLRRDKVVEVLLRLGADPNLQDNTGMTPLHFAVGKWRQPKKVKRIIELLMAAGADPAIVDKNGASPLDLVGQQPGYKDLLKKK